MSALPSPSDDARPNPAARTMIEAHLAAAERAVQRSEFHSADSESDQRNVAWYTPDGRDARLTVTFLGRDPEPEVIGVELTEIDHRRPEPDERSSLERAYLNELADRGPLWLDLVSRIWG